MGYNVASCAVNKETISRQKSHFQQQFYGDLLHIFMDIFIFIYLCSFDHIQQHSSLSASLFAIICVFS